MLQKSYVHLLVHVWFKGHMYICTCMIQRSYVHVWHMYIYDTKVICTCMVQRSYVHMVQNHMLICYFFLLTGIALMDGGDAMKQLSDIKDALVSNYT